MTFPGVPPSLDDRGMSNVVGVTLLVAITVAGALIVVSTGQGTIQETRGQSNDQVAVDTFQQMDSVFRSFARSEDGTANRTIAVSEEIQNDLTINGSTTYRIRLNGNPQCDSGEHAMGSMVYERDGTTIGYEGGGVWERTDGGTVMRSPPSITYQGGGLNLRFPNVTGQLDGSSAIEARSNATATSRMNQNLSVALYTNLSYGETGNIEVVCEPASIENATVWINQSRFAPAWARFARENYDDRRVQVRPTSGIESGTNISMTFLLGDVSDPIYNVTNLTISRASSAGPLWVNTTVRNEGGLAASGPVQLQIGNASDGTVHSQSRTVALDGGNRTRVNFSVADSTLSADFEPGSYAARIVTPNVTRAETFSLSPSGSEDFQITSATAPSEANVGDAAALDVTVENTGSFTGTQTVRYLFNGTVRATRTVQLDAGETRSFSFGLPTQWAGDHGWTVQTDDDAAGGSLVVGTNPYFEITDASIDDSTITTADTAHISADIENIGGLGDTQTVEIRIRDSGGTVLATTTRSLALTSSHRGGATGSVSTSWSPAAPGSYQYTVTTANATTTGTFSVGSPAEPNFQVVSIRPSERPGPHGEQVSFNVTVQNTGDAAGTVPTVTLNTSNGTDLMNRSGVHLAADETASFNTTVLLDDRFPPATYTLEAHIGDGNELTTPYTVVDPETIGSGGSGGEIVVNQTVRSEVRLLATELEGSGQLYGDPPFYITNSPISMTLRIEQANGSVSTVGLWGGDGTDLNHPDVERALVEAADDPDVNNPYNETFTFDNGTSIQLHAASHYCGEYDPTGVVWNDIIQRYPSDDYDARGYACTDWSGDDDWISVTDTDNSQNVVIRGDGEQVPAYDEASPYQRGVQEVLQSRVNESGYLNLSRGERVFMYELSTAGADPENADGPGDPDYNDAIALFRVIEIVETVDAPAQFRITNVTAPTRVAHGEDVWINATINNTGGQAGVADLSAVFGPNAQAARTPVLAPGENATVQFEFSDDVAGGRAYEYNVSVTNETAEARTGQIYVGPEDANPNYIVTNVDAPASAHVGEPFTVRAEITNVGGSTGSQGIELSGPSGTEDAAPNLALASGNSQTVTFTADSATTGVAQFRVETDNVTTSPFSVFVGESDVAIQSLDIGSTSYGNDTLIERRELTNMQFEIVNSGSIGDERTAHLTIRNVSDGSVVHSNTTTIQVGEGQLSSSFPAWVSEDVNLDSGYYTYEFTISDDGTQEDRWVGELYVSNEVSVRSTENSSSPITVDPGEVSIGG